MKTFTFLFLLISSVSFTYAQTYISKSQHVLKKATDGISVDELNETYIVKTDFNSKLTAGAAIYLKLTSDTFNKTYSLILKNITVISDTKEYDFAITSALNSYPSLKVRFEKGGLKSAHDLFISITEGETTFMIYCDKV